MDKVRKSELVELADMLANSWLDPVNQVRIDPRFFPVARAEAYFVQDYMHKLLEQGIVGWKVGATSPRMREIDGHEDVIPGRIFASRCYFGSHHNLPIKHFPGARAEAEFAFQLTAKPHLRQTPWTASEMKTMMVLHPAIEIIGNRFKLKDASKAENSLMTIADNGGGIGFVFGDPVGDWQGIDYQQHLIELSVNGGTPADNFIGEMRCVPEQAAADLVNHLASRGYELQVGDFISTGAASVPQPFSAGDYLRADFGMLGDIEVTF
jgi:2-keto-4-pentenoate hydratase